MQHHINKQKNNSAVGKTGRYTIYVALFGHPTELQCEVCKQTPNPTMPSTNLYGHPKELECEVFMVRT